MKNKGKIKTVILGDLVRSRKIVDRRKELNEIKESLKRTKTIFGGDMIAPLEFSRGMDEISGLLRRPGHCYKICRTLNELIYPNQFRFALVLGEIDIGIGTKNSSLMDGPAYHIAAKLIEESKNQVKVAGKIGITQQAVSDALRRSNWNLISRAYSLMDLYLEGLG